MLEVFYEKATKIVTAWRSEGRQDIRKKRKGEGRVWLGILPPSDEGAWVRDYILDKKTKTLKLRPDFVFPPPRGPGNG
ncbi:hypothetical protein ES708_05911 [subsurface metagenome]